MDRLSTDVSRGNNRPTTMGSRGNRLPRRTSLQMATNRDNFEGIDFFDLNEFRSNDLDQQEEPNSAAVVGDDGGGGGVYPDGDNDNNGAAFVDDDHGDAEASVPLLRKGSDVDKNQATSSSLERDSRGSIPRNSSILLTGSGKELQLVPVSKDAKPIITSGSDLKKRPQSWDGSENWRMTLKATGKDAHPKTIKYRKLKCPCVSNRLWEMEMTKEELIKKYRIHIFVTLIFLITVISVSLSWYYRNVALQALHSSQAIFFNPRNRELTLADPSNSLRVRGFLARDIPPWQLPLHCPIVMGDNPHSKECVWKNNAILRVQHFGSDGVQCYNVSWESLDPMHVPHDCFDVSTDLWYGPSNKSDSTFPIKGQFGFQPVNYSIGNNGLFSSVVDFYWLSSGGAALRVNGNDPIQVAWNQSGNDELCILSNYTGPLYHQKYAVTSAFMNYTLCNGLDILTTHKFMQSMFAPPQQVHYPPKHVFQGPHWSLKGAAKTLNVTQEHVLDLAVKVNDYGFQGNKITVDGNWQRDHGDLVFDSQRFSNWTNVTDSLELYDCQLTLCVSPYFQYRSDNFHQGVAKSMFVKDAGGEVTGLTNFQGGLAAILDVFKPDGTKWYLDKLKADLSPFGIKSYRLTYGRQAWLPYKPHFYSDDATPNMYRKMLTEALSFVSDSLTVEHTSDSRHVTSLLPVATELGVTGDKLCLNGAIETALTLGLLGYPFVMADGFTTTSKALVQRFATDGRPPRELYIRWLQLVTFFPSFQFSIAPWEYDEDVVSMATNLSARHEALVIPELQNKVLKQEVGLGYPILRPVWWLDPKNITVHKMEIKDEFLVGNNLLVAPVLCQGETSRDIYVPPGVWEDLHDGSFILGPNTLRNYRILPHEIAVFVRREVVGDRTRPEL